jgi:hypothetical protein
MSSVSAVLELENTSCPLQHVAEIAQLEMKGHRKRLPALHGDAYFGTKLNSGPSDGPLRGEAVWQALGLISGALCSVPRDRVFGILALPGLPEMDIVPDANKSTVQT